MIKEFFVFTKSSLCLYAWQSPQTSNVTDSTLIGALLFAMIDFANHAFDDRFQKLELDNSYLIMTAKEFKPSNPNSVNSDNNTLIFAGLVDKRDNIKLCYKLLLDVGEKIVKYYDFSGIKTIQSTELNESVLAYYNEKTYARNNKQASIAIIIGLLGVFLSTVFYTFRWELLAPRELTELIEVVTAFLTAFIVIGVSGAIIGEKYKAVKLLLIANITMSVVSYFLFETIIAESEYFAKLGTVLTYILFVALSSFVSGLFGAMYTERNYLFAENQ